MGKINYDLLPLGKTNPEHQPSRKKTLQASYKTLRPRVREDTFERDGGRCRCCWKALLLQTDAPFQLAHIHETEGPRHEAAIDVSLRVTITLCHECHIENVEKNRVTITYESEELKCNGRVFFRGRHRVSGLIDRASDPLIPYERFKAERALRNRA